MHTFMFIFVALLFYVLTPGVFVSLPPKGSKMTVAMTHAIVFALVWTLIHKSVWEWGVATGWIKRSGGKKAPASHIEGMIEGARSKHGKGKIHGSKNKHHSYSGDRIRPASGSRSSWGWGSGF